MSTNQIDNAAPHSPKRNNNTKIDCVFLFARILSSHFQFQFSFPFPISSVWRKKEKKRRLNSPPASFCRLHGFSLPPPRLLAAFAGRTATALTFLYACRNQQCVADRRTIPKIKQQSNAYNPHLTIATPIATHAQKKNTHAT